MESADTDLPLGPTEFVNVVYETVFVSAVRNVMATLTNPPGRQPGARLMAMHDWYETLADEDREMLREVIKEGADHAVFSMLCLLDNVSPVVDGHRQTLELMVRDAHGSRPLGAADEEYHDIFRARVDEASGWEN